MTSDIQVIQQNKGIYVFKRNKKRCGGRRKQRQVFLFRGRRPPHNMPKTFVSKMRIILLMLNEERYPNLL
jgi:hypothetical protein